MLYEARSWAEIEAFLFRSGPAQPTPPEVLIVSCFDGKQQIRSYIDVLRVALSTSCQRASLPGFCRIA